MHRARCKIKGSSFNAGGVNDGNVFGRKKASEDALGVLIDVAHASIVPQCGWMSSPKKCCLIDQINVNMGTCLSEWISLFHQEHREVYSSGQVVLSGPEMVQDFDRFVMPEQRMF